MIIRRSTAFGLGLLGVVASGCGGSAPADPAANPDACSHTPVRVFLGVKLDNSLCFPRSLTLDDAGTTSCRLLVLGSGSPTCDPSKGLGDVDSPTRCALLEEVPPAGTDAGELTMCTVDQLAADCSSSSAPGWCYVIGPNGSTCHQAVHTSPALSIEPGAAAYVTCD